MYPFDGTKLKEDKMSEPIKFQGNIKQVNFSSGQGNETRLTITIPESYQVQAAKLFAVGKERVINVAIEY